MSLLLESLGKQYGRFCFVKTLFSSVCLYLLLLDLRMDNEVKRCITSPTKTYYRYYCESCAAEQTCQQNMPIKALIKSDSVTGQTVPINSLAAANSLSKNTVNTDIAAPLEKHLSIPSVLS